MAPIADRVQSVRELHYDERGHCAECTWEYPCKTRRILEDRKTTPSDLSHWRQRALRAEADNTHALETLRAWRDGRCIEPQTARLLYEVGAALTALDHPTDTTGDTDGG